MEQFCILRNPRIALSTIFYSKAKLNPALPCELCVSAVDNPANAVLRTRR